MRNKFLKFLPLVSEQLSRTGGLLCNILIISLLTATATKGQTWQTVGTVAFSGAEQAYNTCIAIDTGGVPYIVYEDATRYDKATVMKFNGASWIPVDTEGVTPGGAGAPAIAMDKYGNPYIVYSDGTNDDGATVLEHVGSSWVPIGLPNFSGNLINFPSIAIDTSGTIYVAYIDAQYSSSATVMKFTSGGGWLPVGTPGFTSENSAYTSIALDPSGTPYLAYRDGYNGPATVQKFNGTNWVVVGSAGFTPTTTYSTFIKIDKYGTPYMTYAFGNGSYYNGDSAGVMKFNGTNWVSLNPTKFSVTAGNPNINITMDTNAVPYVVYQDFFNAGAATVKKYIGSSWVTDGNAGFSAAGVQYPTIAINKSGTPYVAYMDQGNNYGATVMDLAVIPAITGATSLCMGNSSTLSDGDAGGTWSSNNTSVATIGSSTGAVTTTGTGTATITYTLGGSSVTTVLTVNPEAFIGGGTMMMCVGGTVTLSGTPAGGTWTSNIPSSATVNSSGVVTAIATGDGTIQYILSTGCTASVILEINPTPAITTSTTICTDYTWALVVTEGAGGGTWSSSNPSSVAVYNGSIPYDAGVAPGTSMISYTTPGAGCVATLVVTENADPVISGTPIVCGTSATTLGLSAGVTGGTWSSSNSSITVGSSSGTITGVFSGTSIITYTTPDLACSATQVVTDNPVPVINGFSVICTYTTVELELITGVTGGTWSSSNTASFITYSSAIPPYVWGVGPGTATISYITPGAGCTASMVVTDNADPVISGTFNLCGYGSTTLGLSAGITGGTWSSSNSSVTVGSSSGTITGEAPGTSTITYTAPTGFGCSAYQEVTDNQQPGGISGSTEICAGSTTSYYGYPSGGMWSSGSTSVATVGTDGTVYGVSAGTASIIYTMPGGCDTSRIITVNPLPSAISGPSSVCTGTTITLTDATTGGSWSTSNTSVITIGSGSYLSYEAGTTTITYTMPSGCFVTKVITFNQQPSPVSGSSEICAGSTTSYSDYSGGGMWSSGSTSVATVGTDGTVYGVSAGTASIIYTMPGGCDTSRIITVNPLPSAISGPSAVCTGTTIFLTDATPGGSWSTGSTNITLSGTGSVYGGYVTGAATVTYTMPSGCYVTKVVTVNSQPTGISGVSEICAGSTTSYSDYPSGGMWSSGSTSIATIGTNGTVYGVSAGTVSISYTMPGGCFASTILTIELAPALGGPNTICGTSTASLTASPTGGTWSNSNTSVLSVSGSGVVTGISVGTANISYTIGDGCSSYLNITDNSTPVINTFSTLCTDYTATVGVLEGITGGTWSSGNTASVVVYNGSDPYMWAVAPGTSTLTYTTPGVGCVATLVVTINADPVISGASALCGTSSSTLDLTTGVTGGTWSSSNSSISVGSSSGTITGVSPGTSTITYTTPDLVCMATQVVTDYHQPGGVSGSSEICAGSTTSYSDYPSGGLWSSGSTSVATVGTDGTVYGISAGTASIIYTMPGGCDTSSVITIEPLPSAISGPSAVCVGSTITLTDATPGGSWSTGSATIFLEGSGSVLGYVAGTATVTYTMPSGCYVTTVITISQLPGTISGASAICVGSTTSYSDYPSGGMWSSGSTSVATVGTDGTVYGVGAGNAIINYTMPGGCYASSEIIVNPSPSPIIGSSAVCVGSTIDLTDATPGGSWSTSSPSIFLTDTGSVLGYVPGTAIVMYTLPSGCFVSGVVVVNQAPGAMSGSSAICDGSTTSYSDSPEGGVWSSGTTGVASIGTNGIVLGVSAGTANITYTTSAGCYTSSVITINPLPSPISGPSAVCIGSTIVLTDAIPGGSWSTSSATIILSDTGSVAGYVLGSATVTYTAPSGCYVTKLITVSAGSAGTIAGASSVNVGSHITLTDGVSGGVWSASNPSATVSGGVVTGITAGTVTISYAVTGSCGTIYATKVIVVNISSIPGISGNTVICAGATTSLSDATLGGVWSSTNGAVATVVGSTGIVTGVNAGVVTISYTVGSAIATIIVTVNANPTLIQGATLECAGVTITLTDATAGGVWSGAGDATISGTGTAGTLIAGAVGGTATVTYTLVTGCMGIMTNTVYASPLPITGIFNVCIGAVTDLTDASSGSNWSSSNTAVAVSSGPDITGESAGTAIITFKSNTAGCITTQTVTVSAQPAAITGNTGAVCPGSTISLTDGAGSWTSSNTTIAAIGSTSGIVTGMAGGTAVITYSVLGASGCVAKTTVTVSAMPTITGTATMCIGGTTALHDAVAGGSWSSGSTGIAAVSAAGVVTGAATGTAIITYTTAGGCIGTFIVTVSGTSATISGNLFLCNGATRSLSDASAGGTWSMSSVIATVGSATGVVTASATNTGTATISYTSGGCSATAIITVNANPMPIQGATYECTGITTMLSDVTPGGIWTGAGDAAITGAGSSATLVAGGTTGTATVTYTIGTGCSATMTNTIYTAQPITGNFNLCVGLVTDLTDASPVLSWSSSSTAIATVAGPDVTGQGVGIATITFKSSAAGYCMTTQTVTVNAMPVVTAINGPATISHTGSPVSISDATSGGIWTSSNTSVITLSGSTGNPIGASALVTTGSSVITYAVTIAGCTTKVTKTYSASAAEHGGTTTVYAGSEVNLADDVTTGIWSSSDNGIATVDGSGLVTGITPGNVIITHELTGDDGVVNMSVTNVIVSAAPAIINVLPNPNKGVFMVRGTVGSMADEVVTLEVTDLLGQIIYRSKATAYGGKLNETITLSNALANGMYILNVQSATETRTSHFVIEE